MNKFFLIGLLWASLFVVACGGSSDKSTSDPCTEDPNLPECKTEEEGNTTEPEEKEEVQNPVVEEM